MPLGFGDPMRILAIADDDSLIGHLALDSVELLISLGDIWDSTIARARDRYRPKQIFGVRGNHDSAAPFASFVRPLHLAVETHSGITFGGFDGSWKYKPRGHYLFEQQEVIDRLASFPRVDVFVAHNSPRGWHERDSDVHQGFDGFIRYIERAKPHFFIHGHQHLSQTSRIGDTTVIGIFGERILEVDT
jgi:Icc-related predicted phosphoesterase